MTHFQLNNEITFTAGVPWYRSAGGSPARPSANLPRKQSTRDKPAMVGRVTPCAPGLARHTTARTE